MLSVDLGRDLVAQAVDPGTLFFSACPAGQFLHFAESSFIPHFWRVRMWGVYV